MSPAAAISPLVRAPLVCVDDAAIHHGRHHALMRIYLGRYIVLPEVLATGSIIAELDRRYDPAELAGLEAARLPLERTLIAPAAEAAIRAAAGADVLAYAEALPPRLRAEPENAFTAFLRATPNPEPHYRNFLLQSSADLLAEASASAFGVVGAVRRAAVGPVPHSDRRIWLRRS